MAELDVAFKVFADMKDTVDNIHEKVSRRQPRPVRKPMGNSMVQSATAPSPVLLQIDDTPAVGRMWFVRKVLLAGIDGHTPVTSSTFGTIAAGGSGSVTMPAGQELQTVLISWGNVATANTVTFTITGAAGGTINDSVALAVGQNPPTQLTFTPPLIPATPASTIAINITGNVNSPTATIELNPPLSVSAELYTGPVQGVGAPLAAAPVTDFSSLLVPGVPVPSVTRFGRYDEPMHSHEHVYAILYGLPAGQQIELVVAVDEWYIEDQEAIKI